jgi:uncharacterized membrane protein YcaP (DUF421 family)
MATILYSIIGYCILLLTVRVLSRRPGAQLTLFEFGIIFLVGGAALSATVGRDHSMTNCVTAILAVGLMHRLVSWVKEVSPRMGAIIDGTPLVIVKDGQWQLEVLRGMQLAPEDVMAAARAKQIDSIFDVKYAILERNGSISIIKRSES